MTRKRKLITTYGAAGCAHCGRPFDPAARSDTPPPAKRLWLTRYCSQACSRKAENHRYYAANKARLLEAAKAKREAARDPEPTPP